MESPQNQPPPQGTLTMTSQAIAMLATFVLGLGGGFLAFYQNICAPQVAYHQTQNQRLSDELDKLSEVIVTNTATTNQLLQELKQKQ